MAQPSRGQIAAASLFANSCRPDGLEIRGSPLDAVDETPVLDVKPYLEGFAPRGEIREAAWANELMAIFS
jgi:tRNA (Thr-GGU) A37 N-methylase